MCPLFWEPELNTPDPRSYLDLPTNVGLIARLSATRNLGNFLVQRLPEDFLLVFLHEAMHHWCFHSALGFAMAGLYERAAVNSAKFAASVHGESSLSIGESGHIPELENAFHNLLRFDVACRIMMPFIEGLALFCEFDVQPEIEIGSPIPVSMASTLFGGFPDSKRNKPGDLFSERLLKFRRTEEMIDRKHRVLLMDPTPSASPYLAGYLSVRSTWSAAAAFCPALARASVFATFLRNYIFEDLGLVRCLLKTDISGPNNEMPFASAFATRLRDRSRALLVPKTYEDFGKYKKALERAINDNRDPQEPYHPDLSLTDPETVADGWKAICEMVEEFNRASEGGAKDAIYWSAARTALAQRHVMTLEVASVHVRIVNGICSVLPDSRAKIPLLTGALSRVSSANGKEGPGYLVMLAPTQIPVPFIGVVMNEEVVCDSIPNGVPSGIADTCRSVAGTIPVKMQLGNMSESNLNVLVRRVQEKYMTGVNIFKPILDEIYMGQAMPWLRRDEREVVVSFLLQEGNGLAALFTKGKKHLLKAVVSLSLGIGFGVLLDEAAQDESILDVINRINKMTRNVWHQGLIHVHDDENCSTLI